MDGSFACPECGGTIEVRGLSPGRLTRCDFCNRLVEIPFIPRITDPRWHRLRSRRSRWLILGWSAIVVGLVAIVIGGTSRLLTRRDRLARLETINRLTQSAARQRAAGAYGLALVDLDSAIALLQCMDPTNSRSDIASLRRVREKTALQDAEKILADLTRRDDLPPAVGAWLNLRARLSKDSDLSAYKGKVEAAFQAQLSKYLDSEYRVASSALESRKFVQSFESCHQLDRVIKFLAPDVREEWRNRLEQFVAALVQVAGVVVTESRGQLLEDSHQNTYMPDILKTVTKALREKDYVPPPASKSWRSLWSRAPFRLNLEVTERREGNYHATRNRLTRIELQLTLSSQEFILWNTTSIARSRVPLEQVPAAISKQLAISRARIDEFEHLLYIDAESLIDAHLANSLKDLPRCPANSPGVPIVPSAASG
jgi:hypothetical protein